jgi:pimeloyl-ACP methyl ester carboxylesterase
MKKLAAASLLAAAAALTGGGRAAADSTVHLKTSDGWKLTANYDAPKKAKAAVVLLHGLDSSKEEWGPLVEALDARGIASLAIDLRGHGKSLGPHDGQTTWHTFLPGPEGDWAMLWHDAEAGAKYLQKKGFGTLGLVGASLGAEAALRAGVQLPDVKFAALLSPVLDPGKPESRSLVQGFGPRAMLFAASPPDSRAHASATGLVRVRSDAALPVDWIEGVSGHGAQMLADPGTLARIADWIAARAAPPAPPAR